MLAETKLKFHADVSSSLYFSTLVSAFIPVRFYQYRPADSGVSNFSSQPAGLCALPCKNESIKSLSCMHAVKHVGLGRHGNALDPDGDVKAMNELKRVLAKGGDVLLGLGD